MTKGAHMDERSTDRFRGLWRLVGNTPIHVIEFTFRGERRILYAKSESHNLTGSIKDRMALYILERAYETGQIRPGDEIVEATSGNTGISFAALGRSLGHPVSILMPDWMSRERVEIIRSLGGKVIPVTREQGGFLGSIKLAEEMAEERDDIFLPRQFSNEANIGAHLETTGPEILAQLQSNDLEPDGFVAGVGTGGTIMGVSRYLRRHCPSSRFHPLEPEESPTLSVGHKVGQHRIQGISDEFIPSIVNLEELDSVVSVSDGDAILMAQRLAGEMGIAVGISSGANFLGALKVQNEIGPDSTVVTVFPDCNKKYLSTDLLREEPPKKGYLAPDVELTGFRVFKRVCTTCCELFECPERKRGEG